MEPWETNVLVGKTCRYRECEKNNIVLGITRLQVIQSCQHI